MDTLAWSAIDLGNCSTDFLKDILARAYGPADARKAIKQELSYRKEKE